MVWDVLRGKNRENSWELELGGSWGLGVGRVELGVYG